MSNNSSPSKNSGSPYSSPLKNSGSPHKSPSSSPQRSSPVKSSPSKQVSATDFAAMTSRVENLDLEIDPSNPQSLLRAKGDIDSIVRDLENFNAAGANKFSADDDGSEGVHLEASLVSDIGELLEQTKMLQDHINKQVKAMDRYTDDEPPAQETDSVRPLEREEIAKLLLLVARAYGIQQISVEQRAFIKNEICGRKGYLRNILLQDDIGAVISSLADLNTGNKM